MDIIEAIAEHLTLRQKVEWGINTCINLRPYMREEYKKYNEQDIAIGQAWLNGETEFKTGMFSKQKIKEYSGGVSVGGVGVGGVSVGVGGVSVGGVSVGGVGVGGVSVSVGGVSVGGGFGNNEVERQLIESTISFGLNIVLKNKPIEKQKELLKSFAGLEGFTNLEYLEKVEEISKVLI